jgi:uncharacterized membrane protein
MEQKAKYKSSQNFATLAVSMGLLLIVVAIISGTSIFVAFGRGILIRTLADVRTNVVRIFFDFLVPMAGGIILVLAGLRLLKMDREIFHKSIKSDSKKKVTEQKEQILNVFLSNDEKKVMELIKNDPDGALQSDLVIKTGYSKVKMHRILKSLENKSLIKRGRFGITNRVLVNKY